MNYVCNPTRPIGKDILQKWMKSLVKQCNLKKWDKVTNQNGRQHFIGKMNRTEETISD